MQHEVTAAFIAFWDDGRLDAEDVHQPLTMLAVENSYNGDCGTCGCEYLLQLVTC